MLGTIVWFPGSATTKPPTSTGSRTWLMRSTKKVWSCTTSSPRSSTTTLSHWRDSIQITRTRQRFAFRPRTCSGDQDGDTKRSKERENKALTNPFMYPFMNVPRYSCCGTITYWKITKADGTVLSSGRATPEKVEGSFLIAKFLKKYSWAITVKQS